MFLTLAGLGCVRGGSLAGSRAGDARPRGRPGLQAGSGDGGAAPLADPVGTGCQPLEGGVDLGEVTPDLAHERRDLGPLEGDGGALGVVLVVGVAVEGGGDDSVEVVAEPGKPTQCLDPLRLEQGARVRTGHDAEPNDRDG